MTDSQPSTSPTFECLDDYWRQHSSILRPLCLIHREVNFFILTSSALMPFSRAWASALTKQQEAPLLSEWHLPLYKVSSCCWDRKRLLVSWRRREAGKKLSLCVMFWFREKGVVGDRRLKTSGAAVGNGPDWQGQRNRRDPAPELKSHCSILGRVCQASGEKTLTVLDKCWKDIVDKTDEGRQRWS